MIRSGRLSDRCRRSGAFGSRLALGRLGGFPRVAHDGLLRPGLGRPRLARRTALLNRRCRGRFGHRFRLSLNAQCDAQQPAADRKHQFVDFALIKQCKHAGETRPLILWTMCVGTDCDPDIALFTFCEQPPVCRQVARLLVLAMVAIQEAGIELDGHSARFARVEQGVFVAVEGCIVRPMSEQRRNVEVAHDIARQPLDRVEQRRHIQLPGARRTDELENTAELGVVERPIPVRSMYRMVDRQKVYRPDHAVGLHRIDDILSIGPRARIIIDLGADRVAHPAPQAVRDDRSVADLDAGGLGSAVEVAGLGEFEGASHEIDRGRVFEREVVHVVGDHHEARPPAPAGVIEPKEQHPRRKRDRTLVAKRLVLTLSVPVYVWYRVYARVVFDVIVQVVVFRGDSATRRNAFAVWPSRCLDIRRGGGKPTGAEGRRERARRRSGVACGPQPHCSSGGRAQTRLGSLAVFAAEAFGRLEIVKEKKAGHGGRRTRSRISVIGCAD